MKKQLLNIGLCVLLAGCSSIPVASIIEKEIVTDSRQTIKDENGNGLLVTESEKQLSIDVRNYVPFHEEIKEKLEFPYTLQVLKMKYSQDEHGTDLVLILTTVSDKYPGKYHDEQPIVYIFEWYMNDMTTSYLNISYGYDPDMDSQYDPLYYFTEADAQILVEEFSKYYK